MNNNTKVPERILYYMYRFLDFCDLSMEARVHYCQRLIVFFELQESVHHFLCVQGVRDMLKIFLEKCTDVNVVQSISALPQIEAITYVSSCVSIFHGDTGIHVFVEMRCTFPKRLCWVLGASA